MRTQENNQNLEVVRHIHKHFFNKDIHYLEKNIVCNNLQNIKPTQNLKRKCRGISSSPDLEDIQKKQKKRINKKIKVQKNEIYNKGITLVALVITIIILIILAGVTISLTLKQNGILGKTETARVLTKIARSRRRGKINRIR